MTNKCLSQIFVGTSGWSFKHWKENFYPKGLKQADWLQYYSETFSTVEINTTFYRSPLVSTIENWQAHVPKDFQFSIKANRIITHFKRLKNCGERIEYLYKNIEKFKSKTGPILFQLPPTFTFDKDRLTEFIQCLDKKHKHVFEFRHESWFIPEVFDLLSKYRIALCITDLNGKLSPEEITTDFTYIRLHGPKSAYVGSYSTSQIKAWQKKIQKWSLNGTSIYCYFDNDDKGYAIKDAKSLKSLLEV